MRLIGLITTGREFPDVWQADALLLSIGAGFSLF